MEDLEAIQKPAVATSVPLLLDSGSHHSLLPPVVELVPVESVIVRMRETHAPFLLDRLLCPIRNHIRPPVTRTHVPTRPMHNPLVMHSDRTTGHLAIHDLLTLGVLLGPLLHLHPNAMRLLPTRSKRHMRPQLPGLPAPWDKSETPVLFRSRIEGQGEGRSPGVGAGDLGRRPYERGTKVHI